MPLEPDTIYAIRNDLTHTFLDFTGNTVRNAFGTPTLSPLACSTMLTHISSVMGWGWHGGNNQKVGDEVFSAAHMRMHPVVHSGSFSKLAPPV